MLPGGSPAAEGPGGRRFRASLRAVPSCTIDGKQIEISAGTTVLEAALQHGIPIQYFCWHPDLAVDGNCRTCMVEIEKLPRLQIACNTVVTEGMVVHTDSAKAREAQRSALEFLLLNHPIDCPVCDQAGECYLQDNYMLYGLYDSKVDLEEKVSATSGFRFQKAVDLGPIVLDSERCVHCSRCIRFEREVTGTNLMEFRWRADHMEIATFQDRPITHAYAGNLAEVCPVGALTDHDFRFKMRVWFLESTPSVCPGCSTGCNIFWITGTARSTDSVAGATWRSTGPGCAIRAAPSTRASPSPPGSRAPV